LPPHTVNKRYGEVLPLNRNDRLENRPYDDEEEDPLAAGRGIVYGLLFGGLLWSVLIGAAWYLLH